ncbi:hypothetical protein EBZ35_05555 [bacterium]|nr:hypothetical protein [bacterium]
MQSNTKLEIVITRTKSRFMATCTSFPGCKGAAATEADAIIKLQSSIARKIASVAKQALGTIMDGPALIHEAVGGQKKSEQRVRKVYKVDPALFAMAKGGVTSLRYPDEDGLVRIPPERDIKRLLATLSPDFSVQDMMADDDDMDDALWLPISLN